MKNKIPLGGALASALIRSLVPLSDWKTVATAVLAVYGAVMVMRVPRV